MQAPASESVQRERVLGAFLAEHWRLPIPRQGAAPAGFSAAETSLDPATCGSCHPKQYAEWSTSFHAGAYSPGFAGQLIEGSLAAPDQARACQTCHTPLAEQMPFDASLAANPDFDAGLRSHGVVCAACHVRAHAVFGPPRRADAAPLAEPVPHAGFSVREEYQEGRFCAPCHQFFDEPGVNGKPVENTFTEWQQSPQAAEGRSCQSCHMPDRAHLWRGIHDEAMVRGAVDVDLVALELSGLRLHAALVLHNRDVGHAFPTYVTPRVFLAVWQVDAAGRELGDSRADATIGRQLDFSSQPWREVFDTRVSPGESVKLDYARERRPEAVAIVGRVSVDPDFHYRDVFAALVETLEQPEARTLIEVAHRRTNEARYVLAEIRRALPEPSR
jgi:hypothetical protein